jgi:hypothetical protein
MFILKVASIMATFFIFTEFRLTTMRIRFGLNITLMLFVLYSCGPNNVSTPVAVKKVEIPAKNGFQLKIDSLKHAAAAGDLVVRLGDDMLSYSIRFLSQKDPAFSHAGIVVEREGRKLVCHIAPDEDGADTIRYDVLDSFINPAKNLMCALYRYNLSAAERETFVGKLSQVGNNKIHFDRVYDLATDDLLYCSEMIAKSLKSATNGRITIKESFLPKRMLPLMYSYFKKENASKQVIAQRKYVSLDNLYLTPGCSQIMRFPLQATN